MSAPSPAPARQTEAAPPARETDGPALTTDVKSNVWRYAKRFKSDELQSIKSRHRCNVSDEFNGDSCSVNVAGASGNEALQSIKELCAAIEGETKECKVSLNDLPTDRLDAALKETRRRHQNVMAKVYNGQL
jgi:hypothetical protein